MYLHAYPYIYVCLRVCVYICLKNKMGSDVDHKEKTAKGGISFVNAEETRGKSFYI